MEAARPALDLLDRCLGQFPIRSILDLGCGDWNWMRHFVPLHGQNKDIEYVGWDAEQTPVAWLNETSGRSNIHFEARDICTEPLPSADLVILRDVLFHLQPAIVNSILQRVKNDHGFLAATSFNSYQDPLAPREYLRIDGWLFGVLNVNDPAFGLADRQVDQVVEPAGKHSGYDRYLNLYDLR